jgi:hypothetical protein
LAPASWTVANTFNAYSTLFIQNTTPNPNTITVTVINRATGLPLTNQIVQTLPAFGNYLMNPFNNDNDPDGPLNPLYAEMGGNFNGSAVISASAPIVGVGFTFNPQATTVQNTAGGYKLMPPAGASSLVIGPRFARVCTSCADFTDINDFAQFGNAQIINVGNAPVTLTSIEFLKADGTNQFTINAGNQATYFLPGQSLTLQPGASIAINTRTGGSLDRGNTGPSVHVAQAGHDLRRQLQRQHSRDGAGWLADQGNRDRDAPGLALGYLQRLQPLITIR